MTLWLKTTQNLEGKSVFNYKIDLVETKCGVRWVITIICVTYLQKDI